MKSAAIRPIAAEKRGSMNILITNDDGIQSDGIVRLAAAAQKFGKVWAVAPDGQRSAASHSISLHSDIDVFPCAFPVADVTAYACSGMPGDCVRVGGLYLMPELPDVVLSGINNGCNAASDLQYSGTAGAAFEGAFQGWQAIAFSEYTVNCHEVTDAYLEQLLAELLPLRLPAGQIWNVNFPGCPLSECKGILRNRTVSESMFYRDRYKLVKQLDNGGMRVTVDGQYQEEAEDGTDLRALIDKYVSVGTVNNIGYPLHDPS